MNMNETNVEDARMAMYARILRCPVEETPKDCPLKDVRNRPVEERIVWLEGKSDQELVALHEHHKKCLADKLIQPKFLQSKPDGQ